MGDLRSVAGKLLSCGLCLWSGLVVWAGDVSLPRSSPESQGVSSRMVLEFVQAADRQVHSMHSFMLVRNGHVVAEAWWAPESADKPHVL
ncbi:MAG: FmtA-like protein, partial [Planctomycetota bacterium]